MGEERRFIYKLLNKSNPSLVISYVLFSITVLSDLRGFCSRVSVQIDCSVDSLKSVKCRLKYSS